MLHKHVYGISVIASYNAVGIAPVHVYCTAITANNVHSQYVPNH